jgi:hypothetical protein
MNKCAWLFGVLLVVACGGRAQSDGNSGTGAGQASAGTGAGNTAGGAPSTGASGSGHAGGGDDGAGAQASCPDNLPSTEPSEGAPCPLPGLSCPGFGSLSCPLTAVCSADSKWEINCPSTMLLGPCSCPHHDFGHVPTEHRATAAVCSHTRAPGLAIPDGFCTGTCQCEQDSQCTSGTNGRCVLRLPSPPLCSYDECFSDSNCGSGSVCQCRAPLDGHDANYCTPASTCRVDADCGANGFCSPSQSHEYCGTFYACHTADDDCVNDSDCAVDSHCDYDTMAKHWVCGNLCGGAPG